MLRFSAPSPALVISLIALFVAIGGTSYAVMRLPAKSVGTLQLQDRSVTQPKLGTGAVTARAVATNALTGAQIDEGMLGEVPAGGIAGLGYRSRVVTVPTRTVATETVKCGGAMVAIAGGAEASHDMSALMVDSHPVAGAWQVSIANSTPLDVSKAIWAVCAKPAPGSGFTAATAAQAPHTTFSPIAR